MDHLFVEVPELDFPLVNSPGLRRREGFLCTTYILFSNVDKLLSKPVTMLRRLEFFPYIGKLCQL
jgi:hypothetical protein